MAIRLQPPVRIARTHGARSGQAMVELVCAVVAMLVLAAFIIQFAYIGVAHNRVTTQARKEAGENAMQTPPPTSSPDFIRDWQPVATTLRTQRYSADDTSIPSTAGGQFESLFVERASPSDGGWDQISQSPSDHLSAMRGVLTPSSFFGLVDGLDSTNVPIQIPGFASLIYDTTVYSHEGFPVKSHVWMTVSGGFYE